MDVVSDRDDTALHASTSLSSDLMVVDGGVIEQSSSTPTSAVAG